MKTNKILPIFIMAIMMAVMVYAQQPQGRTWLGYEAVIKSDQIENFEKSLKEVNLLFAEDNHPYDFQVYQSIGFKYYFFRELENIAEYDQMISATSETFQKIDQAIVDNYLQCFEYKTFIIEELPNESYNPQEQRLTWDEYAYAIWDVHYVKHGKTEEYFQIVDDIFELIKKQGFNDPIIAVRGRIGTKSQMYIYNLVGRDAIDMRQQNKKMWELLGEEGKKLFDKMVSLLYDREIIEFWHRKGLSYPVEE